MQGKILILFLLFFSFSGLSQTQEKKLAAGIYTGASDYYGELNTQFFNINKALRVQLGGTLFYYLSPSFHAGIDVGFGGHGFHLPNKDKYRAQVMKGSGQLRFVMNNGLILPVNSKYQPYVMIGSGFANTFVDLEMTNVPGLDWTANLGFGINYKLNDYISLNYNTNWAITNNDIRDGKVVGAFNDMFMIHSIGIVIPIAKIIDTDEDGVHDGRDRCPNTPVGVAVDMLGCPFDSDNDGVADYQDQCSDKFGLPSAFGCPDMDDDGVPDSEDKCPEIAGPRETNGCPDNDGDGIINDLDKCPDDKGPAATNGCPDRDQDGIFDNLDECPDVKGIAAFNGCPDTDGDGIIDSKDKCPKIAGTIENDGCPEIEEATKKVFEKALKGIQFETGKSIIKKSSYSVLDEVVQILVKNPSYNLEISGHTDNQGDETANLLLSQARALAVKTYLIEKSIQPNRLSSEGFGETQPKTTNENAAGRAINRRVEFVVRFEE